MQRAGAVASFIGWIVVSFVAVVFAAAVPVLLCIGMLNDSDADLFVPLLLCAFLSFIVAPVASLLPFRAAWIAARRSEAETGKSRITPVVIGGSVVIIIVLEAAFGFIGLLALVT